MDELKKKKKTESPETHPYIYVDEIYVDLASQSLEKTNGLKINKSGTTGYLHRKKHDLIRPLYDSISQNQL